MMDNNEFEAQDALAVLPERMVKDLLKPGVVFSEPVVEKKYRVINATEVIIRRTKVIARPLATIILKPNGVTVERFRDPARVLAIWIPIVSVIFWGAVMILHPPWRPGVNFLEEVRQLIEGIRQKST